MLPPHGRRVPTLSWRGRSRGRGRLARCQPSKVWASLVASHASRVVSSRHAPISPSDTAREEDQKQRRRRRRPCGRARSIWNIHDVQGRSIAGTAHEPRADAAHYSQQAAVAARLCPCMPPFSRSPLVPEVIERRPARVVKELIK